MPINNANISPKEIIIIQRNSTNEYYGETHISGSELIFYTDQFGYVNADKSASFYTIFPPPSSGLIVGNTYPITASWAKSASWASHSVSASWAPGTLVSGDTYDITSSWAENASRAKESDFSISSSWASSSLSSSYISYNGNRTIKRSPYTTLNVGGDDLVEFIENFFFPFIPATVAISSAGTYYYETGSTQNFSISSTVTANDEISYGSGSVRRDGIVWNTTSTIPPLTFAFTDTGISSSHSYITYVQTNNNGTPTVINSSARAASFIYPYLWGMSSTAGLTGSNLYNAFTKQIVASGNKTVSMIGNVVYIYFAYPSSYGSLVSILDPNTFEALGNFDHSSSVSVTSNGLIYNWTTNYEVYRTTLVSDPNGNYQFKLTY